MTPPGTETHGGRLADFGRALRLGAVDRRLRLSAVGRATSAGRRRPGGVRRGAARRGVR
ncbi:hypothetical protein ACWEWD_00860 [Streptomyces tendae]